MFNHEPDGYDCVFCKMAGGDESPFKRLADIVVQTDDVMAFIAPKWWPNNRGHVLVVPVAHYENLYDLPTTVGHSIHDVTRDVAIALKSAYSCDGITTRQHNEPAGDQEVWHYHQHVFPRYEGDDFYATEHVQEFLTDAERAEFAHLVRSALAD